MKKINLNGLRLELYAGIEELPITRFQEFNRLMLIDAGIGGDLDAVDRHLGAILRYNARGEKEKLTKEAVNLRQNLAFTMSHISPQMGAFVALIKTIDGEPVDDLSEEGIKRTLARLSKAGGTVQWLKDLLGEVKKKLEDELEVFFPALADSAQVKEFFSLLRKRTLALLDYIIDGRPKEEIDVVDEQIFLLYEPKTFAGNTGLEVRFIRLFEETCVLLGQQTKKDPKQMTVVEFYYALDLVKKQLKPNRRKVGKPQPNV